MIKKKAINKSTILILILALVVFVFFSVELVQIFAKRELSLRWTQSISDKINCHAVSYSGDLVGIGTDTGFCYVFDQSGKKVFEKKFPFPVLALKFSFNSHFLFIKSYSLFAVNLTTQKIVWEKFKKDYVVEDFWVFRESNGDSRCGVFMHSTKDITLLYQYLDQKGQTVKEFTLTPEVFGNYSLTTSINGKYLLLSLQEGDLYLFQSDGIVVWNIHLDPPVKEVSSVFPSYPIYQAVTKDGSVCLAYPAEEYGKDLFVSELINNKANIVWKNILSTPITGLTLSPDERKVMISSRNRLVVFEISGKTLYSLDQFGYKPSVTSLGTTNVLVGFLPDEDTKAREDNAVVFKLISLNRKHVLWQKRSVKDFIDFSMAQNGYVFVETSLHRVIFYHYVLQ